MKKVFVLGGTGFLGYHTVKELLSRGYSVRTLSLPPNPADDLFPAEVEAHLGDINDMTDAEIKELLKDVDGFVYAIGADERWLPDAPAFAAFYKANVLPTQRLVRLATEVGVQNFVIFGSYFAEFADRLPQYHLRDQPYPNNRLLQEQIAFAEGEGNMNVSALRLPYIFGTMPGRKPLWSMFVEQAKGQAVFPALKGGTAMVTANQVAEAAVSALERGVHRQTYAICDTNMKFEEFNQLIVEALGQQDTTQVSVIPFAAIKDQVAKMDEQAAAEGKEHGIHMVVSQQMQEEDLYLDPKDTQEILNITKEPDMRSVIMETLKASI